MLYYLELALLELLTIALLYLSHQPIVLLHILSLKNQTLLFYSCLDCNFFYNLINFLLISYSDIMLQNILTYQNEALLFFFFYEYYEREFELWETFLQIEDDYYYYYYCLYFDYFGCLHYFDLILLMILLLNGLHIHLLFYMMIMCFDFALISLEISNADSFEELYILKILYLLIAVLLMFLEELLEMKSPLFGFLLSFLVFLLEFFPFF